MSCIIISFQNYCRFAHAKFFLCAFADVSLAARLSQGFSRSPSERNEKLFKDGVISNADFQASQSNLKSLEANLRASDAGIRSSQDAARGADYSVASAEASLKELRTSLNRTTILAPESGIISLLNIEMNSNWNFACY